MRKDGYNYIEDGDYPKSDKPVWVDTIKGSFMGFYKGGKWFTMKRIAGDLFEPITVQVVCWKELTEKKEENK